MSQHDREFDPIVSGLRQALPPFGSNQLNSDLWPRLAVRLQPAPRVFGLREALIGGLALLALAGFPELIPAVLYHF